MPVATWKKHPPSWRPTHWKWGVLTKVCIVQKCKPARFFCGYLGILLPGLHTQMSEWPCEGQQKAVKEAKEVPVLTKKTTFSRVAPHWQSVSELGLSAGCSVPRLLPFSLTSPETRLLWQLKRPVCLPGKLQLKDRTAGCFAKQTNLRKKKKTQTSPINTRQHSSGNSMLAC